MRREVGRRLLAAGAAIGIVVIALLAIRRVARLSSEQVRERVVATIQSEAKESFLVTGSVDLTATTTIENSKTLLPGILDLNLGSARATVQVPGRAFYGFDVRSLDARSVRVLGDTIEVIVPQPRLLSVAANLNELEVWTEKGWLRTSASLAGAERAAIKRIDYALATQASSYVRTSTQPRVNSAHALHRMLMPVLAAAGYRDPVFRFRIGDHLVLNDPDPPS